MYNDAFDDMLMTPRRWLQRERGMCSEDDCSEPIEGWCSVCDARGPFCAPKLCRAHLLDHCRRAGHEPPYRLYDVPSSSPTLNRSESDPDDGAGGGGDAA